MVTHLDPVSEPEILPRRIALCVALAALAYGLAHVLPLGETPRDARLVLMLTTLVASLWLTQAISLGTASLIPLVLFPALGVVPLDTLAASYADPIVWMFFGGFVLALGIERWGVHERLALFVLSHLGTKPSHLVLGMLCVASFLSMWLNNTACALLLLPIALALIDTLKTHGGLDPKSQQNFTFNILLGLAYGCSIGGMGTPIGTAPNALFLSAYAPFVQNGAPPLTFAQWCFAFTPLVMVMTPIAWFLLVRISPMRAGNDAALTRLLQDHQRGPLTSPEKRMAGLFVLAAGLWIFRRDIDLGPLVIPGWWHLLPIKNPEIFGDGGVAALVAVLALTIPSGSAPGETLVRFSAVKKIPWDILFLIGGGIAIARAFGSSGLAQAVAEALRPTLHQLPTLVVLLVVCTTVTFLSELSSNTALAALFLPIMTSVSLALEVDPRLLLLPTTLAASCGFMLPVATPPNAIVCATGKVSFARMAVVGFLLNWVGITLITTFVYFLAVPLLGIETSSLPSWTMPLDIIP